MNRRKLSHRSSRDKGASAKSGRRLNRTLLQEVLRWFVPEGELFTKRVFHGNINWMPEQLTMQALIWSAQETKFVTDAFVHAQEVCEELGMRQIAQSYTSMMNALDRYANVFATVLRERFQALAEEAGGRYFTTDGWVLIGFDGSRTTAPRSVSNERAFCAPNYGKGERAKYGKKKSKGMRRQRNRANPPHPQAPQAWVTMLWQMSLRLPWTWRLGPSHSSERDHVKDILAEEEFPENTLFCGDAGFTGYPLWSQIVQQGHHFLVRVGGNVTLLSEQADIKKLGGGIVLCWPKGQMDSGEPPLRLRLVRVKVGKTTMWLLTSVLDRRRLGRKQLVRYYKMRWGIEVEFRGLKQTIDKQALRCRNPKRLLVELDWSLRMMAVVELLALREQISAAAAQKQGAESYDPQDRSLANTLRALRKCMRNLHKSSPTTGGLLRELSQALVQRYRNRTDKRARYRPKNPDKKSLGEPNIQKLTALERTKLKHHQSIAA
jgi:hypothetical protein